MKEDVLQEDGDEWFNGSIEWKGERVQVTEERRSAQMKRGQGTEG